MRSRRCSRSCSTASRTPSCWPGRCPATNVWYLFGQPSFADALPNSGGDVSLNSLHTPTAVAFALKATGTTDAQALFNSEENAANKESAARSQVRFLRTVRS